MSLELTDGANAEGERHGNERERSGHNGRRLRTVVRHEGTDGQRTERREDQAAKPVDA